MTMNTEPVLSALQKFRDTLRMVPFEGICIRHVADRSIELPAWGATLDETENRLWNEIDLYDGPRTGADHDTLKEGTDQWEDWESGHWEFRGHLNAAIYHLSVPEVQPEGIDRALGAFKLAMDMKMGRESFLSWVTSVCGALDYADECWAASADVEAAFDELMAEIGGGA